MRDLRDHLSPLIDELDVTRLRKDPPPEKRSRLYDPSRVAPNPPGQDPGWRPYSLERFMADVRRALELGAGDDG